MSRAEEKARSYYTLENFDILTMLELGRKCFSEGYNQAQQDLMGKAKQWFTDNIPSEKLQLLWCEFEQFITEN